MRIIGKIFIIIGILLIGIFGYQYLDHQNAQDQALTEAEERIEKGQLTKDLSTTSNSPDNFAIEKEEAFATLEIPALDRTIPIVEGADEESLKNGVGHLSNTALPGQGDQIVLSGHRDTVFRDFGQLEIGSRFTINMPYGERTYEIREEAIVPEDDTSVVGETSEEVLVVSTCYPFDFVGPAPERYVAYAYPLY